MGAPRHALVRLAAPQHTPLWTGHQRSSWQHRELVVKSHAALRRLLLHWLAWDHR